MENPRFIADFVNMDIQSDHHYTQDYYNTPHLTPPHYQIAAMPLDDRGRTNLFEPVYYDGTGYEKKRFAYQGGFQNNTKTKKESTINKGMVCLLAVGIIILVWNNTSLFQTPVQAIATAL